MRNEVLFHQIELLRASCERNSPELSVTLARQLGGHARYQGLSYVVDLAERLEYAVLNRKTSDVFENLKTLEDLIDIPQNAVHLNI